MSDSKNNDTKIRICIYGTVVIVFGFLFGYTPISNHISISNAESCFNKQNYICAFKSYKNAFSNPVDNKAYVEHYFQTLNKMKKNAVVQEELNNLLEHYPESSTAVEIEEVFADLRNELQNQYYDTYIDNVVQGTSVVHWNNKEGAIKIYIAKPDSNAFPEYYVEEVKNAFGDYQNALSNIFNFEFVENQSDAQIEVIFVNSISGGQCSGTKDCASILGLTENTVTGSLLSKSIVRLRMKDTDNTDFTKNQIYNIAKHEIGHSLGVAGHSYKSEDIMYPVSNDASWAENTGTLLIERKEFSPRDIKTFNLLYNIVPDITDKRYKVAKYPDMFFPISILGTKKEIGQKNLEESQQYIKAVDTSYISQINLAEGYFSSKDMESADAAFKNALAYANTDAEKFTVYNNLAVIEYTRENYSQALDYADMANTYSFDAEANEIKAYCYIELKKYRDAQKLLEGLTQKNPTNPTYSASLTGVYFKQYNTFKALKELKRIKKLNPDIVNEQVFKPYKFFLNFV